MSDNWPCHKKPKSEWCDWKGPKDFMGHTCNPPKKGISCFPTETYTRALNKWGYQSQWGMLIEEMGELMQILNKYDRKKATLAQVQDELADVEIMLGQMGIVYGRQAIHRRKIEKINRLEKLIDQ